MKTKQRFTYLLLLIAGLFLWTACSESVELVDYRFERTDREAGFGMAHAVGTVYNHSSDTVNVRVQFTIVGLREGRTHSVYINDLAPNEARKFDDLFSCYEDCSGLELKQLTLR